MPEIGNWALEAFPPGEREIWEEWYEHSRRDPNDTLLAEGDNSASDAVQEDLGQPAELRQSQEAEATDV